MRKAQDAPETEHDKITQDILDAMPEVHAYALKLCNGREHDADDFMQFAILKALEYHECGKLGNNNIAAWMRTTIRNNHIDQWRRASSQREFAKNQGSKHPDEGPADIALRRDFVEHALGEVYNVVHRLSPMYQKSFHLCFVEGLPAANVAEQCGLSPGTIGKHKCDTRRHIRESLPHLLE